MPELAIGLSVARKLEAVERAPRIVLPRLQVKLACPRLGDAIRAGPGKRRSADHVDRKPRPEGSEADVDDHPREARNARVPASSR